jgi:DNA-binding PadR family transcriptional regulator
MMEELRRHGYRLGPGTLYPILHDLHAQGYLTARGEVLTGKRRKNYRITARGRKLLAQARTKLRELVDEVLRNRDRRAQVHRKSPRRPLQRSTRES